MIKLWAMMWLTCLLPYGWWVRFWWRVYWTPRVMILIMEDKKNLTPGPFPRRTPTGGRSGGGEKEAEVK